MIYKLSVLNCLGGLLLLICLSLLLIMRPDETSGDGFEFVAITAFLALGVLALIVDLIAQQLIKDRKILNSTEVLIILIVIVSLWLES